MAEQLDIGDLSTSDAIASAWKRDRRRHKKGEKARELQDSLADDCVRAGLPRPVRQFRFAKHLGREFTADQAFPEWRVLVECEGGLWRRGGGAHSHPSNILRDIEKANYVALCGYFLVRVTTDDVRNGKAVPWIARILETRGWRRT